MGDRSLSELLEAFRNEKQMHCLEGSRGLIHLCTLARAMGYKDPQSFGQLSPDAAVGDLIEFLEDNSGAIEALIEWIGESDNEEWKESLELSIEKGEEEDEEESEEEKQ